ncbi:hypothetical protein PRZ48_007983 [Zasmidium cellare]|uniref:3'-5' exonuclease domain-containing protein n=1 Tax=Zasmidium cellare TaxID=395010 RepID=A0ABR0EEA4_ZASCE|nr:hypothetical protein PRZ48_007983 [Zasmidium cellare]
MASTLETAAPPCATPRLPSTRPIDQRWDRSRGIVFNTTKRSPPRDQTWSQANGVRFAPFSTTATREKFAPLGPARKSNEAPAPQPKASSSPAFNQGYKPSGGAVMSQQLVEGLQQDNKEKARQIERLEKTARENEERLAKLDAELDAQRKKYSAAQESSRIDIGNARKQAAASTRSEYESKMQSQESKHNHSLNSLKSEHQKQAAELERHLKAQLELNPEYTAIVQDMRKKAEKDEASLVREKNALLREQAKCRKSLEELEKQKVQNDEEIEQQKQKLSEEFAKAETSWAESRQMLNERAERGQRDRLNYTVYRDLFDEVHRSVVAFLDPANNTANTLQREADRWRANASRFEDWKKKENKLFDHIPRYKALGKAIGEFLENRASQADAARQSISQASTQLHHSMHDMKAVAHGSRSLTRLLHFEEDVSSHKATRLAYDVGQSEAYYTRAAKQHEKITDAVVALDKCNDPAEAATLRQEVQRMKGEREMYDMIIAASRSMNEIQALEALLDDTTVEQLVYLETLQAERELNSIINEYRHIYDDLASASSRGARQQIKHYLQQEQAIRRTLDDLTSTLRRQFMIELEAGDLDEAKEREKAQNAIKSRMVNLAALLPQPRRGRQARLAAEKAGGSMEALKRSLAPSSAPLKVVSPTARPAVKLIARPSARPMPNRKLAGYKEQLLKQNMAKARLLAKVDGNKDKLDEASKTKLSLAEERIEAAKASISKVERIISKLEKTHPGDERKQADPSKRGDHVEPNSLVDSNKTKNGTKKESRRERIVRRTSPLRIRKHSSGQYEPTSDPGVLNLTPSKPLQAHHGSHRSDLGHMHQHIGPWEMKRSSSWVTLPDEVQVRSSTGVAAISTSEEGSTEYQVDSPQADVRDDTPQSSFMRSDSNSSPAPLEDTTSPEATTDAETSSAAAEGDVVPALNYNMSAKDYRVAATASPNSNAAWWSHKLYKAADGTSPKVLYCTNFETAEKQAKLFLDEPVLGFDLEWEPKSSIAHGTIKRNVSLIQIASEDKIGLFQIALFKGETAAELMPPTLRKILESPDVIKTGVNVSGDTRRMQLCLDVEMKGVMELSHLYRVVKFSANQPKLVSFKLVALADQVRDVLLLPLKKDDSRMSSWSRLLNGQQTHYAAADAYAGLRLFHTLEKQRKEMTPIPPRPAFFETFKPIILGDGTVVERSARKTPGVAAGKKANVDAEGEEEDEFFDAQEELDTYELASSDLASSDLADSASTSTADAPAAQGDDVAYPTLPQVAESSSSVPDVAEPERATTEATQAPTPVQQPPSPALTTASNWISNLQSPKARPSELRAYHLWQHQTLSLEDVATTLRDPPLAMTTVASYVLQAVKEEGLPYDVERMKEVLEFVPKSVHGRYKGVVEKVKKWERERGRSD